MSWTSLILLATTVAVVARLNSEFLEVASLLKSDVGKQFKNEQHFISRAHSVQAEVQDLAGSSYTLSHPIVVKFKDECKGSCHKLIQEKFASSASIPLSTEFALITTSAAEITKFTALNPDVVQYYMAMLPEMKVDAEVSEMAKLTQGDNCLTETQLMNANYKSRSSIKTITKKVSKISFRITMSPLHEQEFNEFQAFTQNIRKETAMKYHFSKPITNQHHVLEITISSCDEIKHIIETFSKRREVIWIERVNPVFTHNRWANGVCDSGEAEVMPLQSNTNANLTGHGDIVGVSDSGIDMMNCYFHDPNVATPYVWADESSASTISTTHRKLVQYYMHRKSNGEATDGYDDGSGHGTHVSSTVAGRGIDRYGDYRTYEGMVSAAKLAFFDIGQETTGSESDLLLPSNLNTELFTVMYQSGARVFTNSWGTTSNSYDSLAVQVDQFMWENPDALVLFSAGNSGDSGYNTVGSPATFKNGATIGASLNDHDSWLFYEGDTDTKYGIEAVASFSSNGPTRDQRQKPDVLAPGYWTTSAYGQFNSSEPFCAITALRGTSMSSPTVAGFAVKIRRYFLDGFYPTGSRDETAGFTPSGALIKAALVHSARPMLYRVDKDTKAITDISNTYPSNIQGYGRIDMSNVLNFAAASTNPINMFVIGGATSADGHYAEFTATSQSHTYTFQTTTDTSAIRLTLAFTDFPGSALTTQSNGAARVNRLSVSISSSGGGSFTPYQGSDVVVDNVQVIDISSPTQSTTYTVTVTCTLLITGPQPYALLITGPTSYVSDQATAASYTTPKDNFTASGGALKYILALGFLTLLLAALIYYFRKISTKKSSMMLDPKEFEATDQYYEEGVQDTGRGGKKSVFTTIRNIRSNHQKAQQARQLEQMRRVQEEQGDGVGFYD